MDSSQASNQNNKDYKRLYLSVDDKKISGVCGGIADYFSVDPTLVRLGWIVITVLTGIVPGLIAYVVAAIVMPQPPAPR